MMIFNILMGTLVCGVGSVLLAYLFAQVLWSRFQQNLLSLAAGALLATAFLHLLPEAFASQAGAADLFLILLMGLIFFFLLDKAELWHHGHEHSHHARSANSADGAKALGTHDPSERHPNHSAHSAHSKDASAQHAVSSMTQAGGHLHHDEPQDNFVGSWSVLLGDSVHAFGDGVLVAGAFLVSLKLGWVATLAVLAHEIPHHMGDLVVLVQGGNAQPKAIAKLALSGAVTSMGGLMAYGLLSGHEDWMPYLLCVASSSYVYVALADLIPQLQKRLSTLHTVMQITWLFAGMGLVQLSLWAMNWA
jgi:zinc and cadmium transporter